MRSFGSDELQTPDVVTAPILLLPAAQERLRDPLTCNRVRKQLADKAAQGDVFAYIKHEDTPQRCVAGGLPAGERLKAQ